MEALKRAARMEHIHSDIRGPLYLKALEMQKNGEKVLKLNTGNPAVFGFELPDSIRKAMEESADKGMAYCDFRGMPEAREAICEYERGKGIRGITMDDVFVGNGVSEVISFALLPLLNDADEVLVPSPSYSLWGNTVYLAGGRPVFYTCDEQAGWFPDLADIRSKITPKTKAIVVINPNNPTGVLYPKEILQEIVNVAREHGLMIFSDEVYDRLILDGKQHVSIASLADDIPVVTMSGLSNPISCALSLRLDGDQRAGKTDRRIQAGNYPDDIHAALCNALAQAAIPAALKDMETSRSMTRPADACMSREKQW